MTRPLFYIISGLDNEFERQRKASGFNREQVKQVDVK